MNHAHSSLFRLLSNDRDIFSLIAAHPVYMLLLKLLPNLKAVRELSADFIEKVAINDSYDSFLPSEAFNSTIIDQSYALSDYNLAKVFFLIMVLFTCGYKVLISCNRLQKVCRQYTEVTQCDNYEGHLNSITLSISRLFETCCFLIDMFDDSSLQIARIHSRRHTIWDDGDLGYDSERRTAMVNRAQNKIKLKVKFIMNTIAGSMINQVQYITISSQRILDSYCLRKKNIAF